jgi:hypothetical protein
MQVLWGIRLNSFSEGMNGKSESLGTEITNNWLHRSTINRDQGPGMIKWLSHIIRTCIGCAMMCMRGSSVLVLCSPSLRAQFQLACVFRLLFSGWKRAFNPRRGTNFWITYVPKVLDCTLLFRILITNLCWKSIIWQVLFFFPSLPNFSLFFFRTLLFNVRMNEKCNNLSIFTNLPCLIYPINIFFVIFYLLTLSAMSDYVTKFLVDVIKWSRTRHSLHCIATRLGDGQ